MRVGVPREIKVHEYRVGLTPEAVREYAAAGHEFWSRPALEPGYPLPTLPMKRPARRSSRAPPRSSPGPSWS